MDGMIAMPAHPKCRFLNIGTMTWVQRHDGEVAFLVGSSPSIGLRMTPDDAEAFANEILAQAAAIRNERPCTLGIA